MSLKTLYEKYSSELINTFAHKFLDRVQPIISSPLFSFWTIVLTLTWMGSNVILALLGKKPLDPPYAFFPGVMLAYSLLALWIENAMKVQQYQQQQLQLEQQRLGAQQLEELNNLSKHIMRSQKMALVFLKELQKLAQENQRRDEVMHNLIAVLEQTVDVVEDNTEELLGRPKRPKK